MNIIKFNDDFESIFDRFFNYPVENKFKTNLKESENNYSLEVVLPGFSKNDIDISIDNDYLIISSEIEDKKEDYKHQEYVKKSFKKSYLLPDDIDKENISAEMIDGILHININKKENVKLTKKIEIK